MESDGEIEEGCNCINCRIARIEHKLEEVGATLEAVLEKQEGKK